MNTGWKSFMYGVGLVIFGAGPLHAEQPECLPQESRLERAGNPHCTAPWARGPNGSRQIGYYVGGGARFRHGSARCADEGVWGVDTQPIVPGLRHATVLRWWHGQKYQGGPGSYEPDHKNHPFENHRENRSLSAGH